jgi:Peptidase E
MRLLLISNSTNFGESYLAWAMCQIEYFTQQNHLAADSKILFVPFAGVNIAGKVFPESYDAYEARVKSVFEMKLGFKNFISVHHFEDKITAVKDADCIIVGGGNTFHLVAEMHRYGLMDAIRDRVLAGMPYIGWSAGSNIACPTLCTTNDMPIVEPASFKTLNLVPFQINPHYLDPHPEIDKMIKHGGETRQDRINEYLAVNQNINVVGLREATSLWLTDGKLMLKGGKKMIVMRFGHEPMEVEPNSDVTFLLG